MEDAITGRAALEVMAGLATPLWLVASGGLVLWYNEAARNRLGLVNSSAGAAVTARWSPDVNTMLAALPQGRRVAGTLAFRTVRAVDSSRRHRETFVSCRLSRAGSLATFAPGGQSEFVGEEDILAEAVDVVRGDLLAEAFDYMPEGLALFEADNRLRLILGSRVVRYET